MTPNRLLSREELKVSWLELLGPFPEGRLGLDAEVVEVEQTEELTRYHVRFRSEGDDWVTAWLLVPNRLEHPSPAIIAPNCTTGGSGKDQIAGLSGHYPGTPPEDPGESLAYGLELARWGYVVLAIDLYADGERVHEGLPPYNTTSFYARCPEWSMVGKCMWDIMRSVDFLQTLEYVDQMRIAAVGHSLGGHMSLFAGAFDERLAAVVTNGGHLSWARETDHWCRPPDPGNRTPISNYVYMPRFEPYLRDRERNVPVDFDSLMMMVAPRPLLIMATEQEIHTHGTVDHVATASQHYRSLGAGDGIFLFSYPGGHRYPPDAKRLSFAWLDRWLQHEPVIPTIWPGAAV